MEYDRNKPAVWARKARTVGFSVCKGGMVPLWVRHVVVPGLTDGEEHLAGLERYLQTIRRIQRVELLPYHTLGVHKYKALRLPYPLEGVPALEESALADWNRRLNETCCEKEQI